MAESHVRAWLTRELKKAGAHVQNVEDGLSTGIPDLNFGLNGRDPWIECKHLSAWPVRPTTRVRFKWRPGQSIWLHRRARSGGECYMLAGIGWPDGDELMLFRGADAHAIEHDRFTRDELHALALAIGKKAVLAHLIKS